MSPKVLYPSPAVLGVIAGRPLHHAAQAAVDSLDDPACKGPRPPGRVEGPDHPVPQPGRLVDGYHHVELLRLSRARLGAHHEEHVDAFGVEGRLIGVGRVLPGVLPAVGEPVLAPSHLGHAGQPVARVGVPDRVGQESQPAVEHRTGDESPVLPALHHIRGLVYQRDAGVLGLGHAERHERQQHSQEDRR